MLRIVIIFILSIISVFGIIKYTNVDDFGLINYYIDRDRDNDSNETIKREKVKESGVIEIKLSHTEALVDKEENIIEKRIIYNEVPFTSQAPYGEWDDARQQNGCEEAVSLMAAYWALGKKLDNNIAKKEILNVSGYQEKNYNNYVDTSVEDTAKIILGEYFDYNNVEVKIVDIIEDIINELENGYLIIAPTNGVLLKNPYYTPPGPERHNILIIGYDYETKEFITNDPGTKRGKDFRYNEDVLYNAICDYPTGDHLLIVEDVRRVIVIRK